VGQSVPAPFYVAPPEVPVAIQDSDFERNFHRIPIDSDLVVLSMTEDLSSLNGADKLAQLRVADSGSDAIPHDLLIDPIDTIVAGSEGFSSGKGYRGTISVDPTDECGRFFIDTIVKQDVLSVIARSTIDPERSSGVIKFSATLANGAPLPDWVSQMADGEYLIDRSVDLEVVALKLVAHRESGSTLVRIVEIDTLTGEIREKEQAESSNSSFYEAMRSGVDLDHAEEELAE